MLAGKRSAHGEEASGDEQAVFSALGNVWHELHVAHREELGIIDERTVYASAVGSLNVTELEAARAELWLGAEVFEAVGVLHLAEPNEGAAHTRQHVGSHL